MVMRVRGQRVADASHQPAQMRPHLDTGGRLARPQHDGDRAACRAVIDMDGEKAALVVMGVEQRQLLMAVHHVAGVVDVQHHPIRRGGVAFHPLIDQSIGQTDGVTDRRGIFQAREGRLGRQIGPGFRQVSAGELERRISAQRAEVVAVLIAARDGEDAGADHVCDRVLHAAWIAPIRDEAGEPLGDPEPALGLGQEHDAAVGRQAPAIESGGDPLAGHGWKRERCGCIVRHGGCGSLEGVAGQVSATKSYAASNA